MINTIGQKDFRDKMNTIANKTHKGESFIVMKHSKPLFKVVPISEEDELWEEVIDFTNIAKGGVDIKDLLSRL